MRVLIPLLVVSAFFMTLSSALAEVPSYAVIKEKSFLKFVAIQNNAPVEGKFEDFTADIRFDPDHVDQSKIIVEVATGSVTASNSDILQNIKMPDWLSVQAFPKAVFTSGKINRMPGTDNYYADGTLTLRDKTVPVVMNFMMERFDAKSAIATGSVTLHRKDFGVGQGAWAKDDVIKDEVRVEFRIAADKK